MTYRPPEEEGIAADLFWPIDKQIERLRPLFPRPRGRARVDDRRVLGGHARLKVWRRVAIRYGRCAKVFLSAIPLAAAIMFWL